MKAAARLASLAATAWIALMAGVCAAQTQAPAPAPTAAAQPAPVNPITGATPNPVWEEEYAYTLGVQAYVYSWPWVYHSLLRWRWGTKGMPDTEPAQMEVNRLSHQRNLTDAMYRDGGRPNADTLYSATWAYVGDEPLILTVPEMGARYYSIQLAGFDSDNFDYIGSRATGPKGGVYAIVGPNWKGALPPGVKATKPAPMPWIFVLPRILVDPTPADVAAVNKLQDQMRLEPLSQYLGKPAGAAKHVPPAPLSRATDALADWKMINRALAESPPPAYEAQILKMFAQVGVGPGLDVEKMGTAIKCGLVRAQETGRMIVTSGPRYQVGRQFHEGWGLTPPNWGRPGPDGNYLVRSAKSFGGFMTHDPEENVYPAMITEPNGEPLSDARKYVLRFPKDQLPPVSAFWSVTMYGPDYNFIDNPINRYAVGDRTKGLKYDSDGSLSIYIQKEPPVGEKVSNWLPSGAGNFYLVLRAYWPKAEVLQGKWLPPGIQRVDLRHRDKEPNGMKSLRRGPAAVVAALLPRVAGPNHHRQMTA